MDRGQNGRDDFFGATRDPFAGFGPQRSLISSFFGGRDPFDDPFFTQPFGGSMMGGPGMFGPSLFGPMGGPFGDMRNGGFIEQAPPTSNGREPVITELEEEDGENADSGNAQANHGSVQEPDDGSDGVEGGQVQPRRDFSNDNGGQPQAPTFTYQSSSVTYGGINGAYYTASKTRRSGSDGITVEESKEADTTTKEATHRISRGIHDKGHSLTRKLKSDGKVDTTQILHNLNEDELAGFEESWKGNARHHLPAGAEPALAQDQGREAEMAKSSVRSQQKPKSYEGGKDIFLGQVSGRGTDGPTPGSAPGPSPFPSSVTVLSVAPYEHQYLSSTADEEEEDDEFEFRPLLPQPRRGAGTECPRTGRRVSAHACKGTNPPLSQSARRTTPTVAAAAKAEQAPPPRRVRWHHMAFGSVRVPSAMDMGEIRRRVKARQALAGSGNEPSAAGWTPWRLIRSLSCKGVEAVAVAAAAAPVRLV